MKEVLAVIFALIFLIVFFAVPIAIFGFVIFLIFKIIKNLIEENKNNNYSSFANIKKEYYSKTAYQVANRYESTSKEITKEEIEDTIFEQPQTELKEIFEENTITEIPERKTEEKIENKTEKKSYNDNYDKDLNGNYSKEL